MTDSRRIPPDHHDQIRECGADRETVVQAVQDIVDEAYDHAPIEVTMGGVHLSWPHPDYPDGEPLIRLFFQGGHPGGGGPGFLTQEATGTVIVDDADGEWHRIEGLQVFADEDLHAELQGRYVPAAGDKASVEQGLKQLLAPAMG